MKCLYGILSVLSSEIKTLSGDDSQATVTQQLNLVTLVVKEGQTQRYC